MKIQFDTNQYFKKLKNSKSYFQTFINKESLATGVLFLKPDQKDIQEPHESDEIYYILSGDGFLQIGKKPYRVKEGQIYFVAKDVPHHFYGNTKNLSVLYFFSGNNS
jgi:mannose-6-phosphate isomerase-like protein (cupin superfamily)